MFNNIIVCGKIYRITCCVLSANDNKASKRLKRSRAFFIIASIYLKTNKIVNFMH